MLRAIQQGVDCEPAWVALTGWLEDNGLFDESEAVRAFWPAIADAVQTGVPLGRTLSLLSKHAPGLAHLARRLER